MNSVAFCNKVVESVINQWYLGGKCQHINSIHFLLSGKCKTPIVFRFRVSVYTWRKYLVVGQISVNADIALIPLSPRSRTLIPCNYNHDQNIWEELQISCKTAHCGKVLSNLFFSIQRIFRKIIPCSFLIFLIFHKSQVVWKLVRQLVFNNFITNKN